MMFNRTVSRRCAVIIAQSRRLSRIAYTVGAVTLGVLVQFNAIVVEDAPAQTAAVAAPADADPPAV